MNMREKAPSGQVIPLLVSRKRGPCSGAGPGVTEPDEVLFHLDLLRGDLYRLLDELARAHPDRQPRLAVEFERSWERFKDTIALKSA